MIRKIIQRDWPDHSVAQDIKVRGKAGDESLARTGLRTEAENDLVVYHGLGINGER